MNTDNDFRGGEIYGFKKTQITFEVSNGEVHASHLRYPAHHTE